MNGILPLYKPKGVTSHDCVMKIRKLLKIKKVGHTGTLDPNVEGVLPICVGEATKIIPFLLDLKKVYIADVALGKSTTTEDSDGETMESTEVVHPPSDAEIESVLRQFIGEIEQMPPLYSAVKIKGKRLYEYARENRYVERPKRHVTIYRLERLPLESKSNNRFRIKVSCSKGTYIRTLCVDIGKKLGFPAHMSYLERIESDSFRKSETVTFEQIEAKLDEDKADELLFPIGRGLEHIDSFSVDERTKQKVLHGQKLPGPQEKFRTSVFKVMHKHELLAIYEINRNNQEEIRPVRVFNIHKNVGELHAND